MPVSPGGSAVLPVRTCPRCGYRGDGISYFRRPGHLALLIGVSLFTYGLGGLAYWLLRRNRYVCPNCGLAWESFRQAVPSGPLPGTQRGKGLDADPSLPPGGFLRRALGVFLILMGTIAIVAGITEFEPGAVIAGSFLGVGGTASFWWGLRALQERRKALMQGLQQKVLLLATARGGTLTVTEVAAELNLSLPAAEKVLVSMDDGFRVRSEISREGILYYEFPEVIHRKSLEAGGGT